MMTRNEKKEEEEVESQPDNWLLNLVLFLLLSLLLSSFLWLYLWFERRLFFGRRSLVANQARGESIERSAGLLLASVYLLCSLVSVECCVCSILLGKKKRREKHTKKTWPSFVQQERERDRAASVCVVCLL